MHHHRQLRTTGRMSPPLSVVAACLMIVGLTACRATPVATPTTSAAPVTLPPSPGSTIGSTAAGLVIEPDQGMAPIYSLLGSPTRSLDLSMYELVDTRAESILAADAARGVAVRVILGHHQESIQNQPAFSYLAAHRVSVRWAPPAWPAFHIKMICVDAATCWVLTLNLTSRYYANTRDFAIRDANPADVGAMEGTFTADFEGSPTTPPAGTDLIWSPGSSARLTGLIASASSDLLVYNEEMSDPSIVAALAAVVRRGVTVKVVMTDEPSWGPDFSALTAAGVQVRVYHGEVPIYVHAKMISVDGKEAFVGSENFSRASLEANRELGVVVTDPATVSAVDLTFGADFSRAQPWGG